MIDKTIVDDCGNIKKRLSYVRWQLIRWKMYHLVPFWAIVIGDGYLHWWLASQPSQYTQNLFLQIMSYFILLITFIMTQSFIWTAAVEGFLGSSTEYGVRNGELVDEYRQLQVKYKDSLYNIR